MKTFKEFTEIGHIKRDLSEKDLSRIVDELREARHNVVPQSFKYLDKLMLTKNTLAYVYSIEVKEFQPVLSDSEHSDFTWIDNWKDADLAGKVYDMLELLNKM